MKRLLTQFIFEWRSNLWLVIELIIVTAALWFSVDYMLTALSIRLEEPGWDTNSTFAITVSPVSKNSPKYVKPEPLPGESDKKAAQRFRYESFCNFLEKVKTIKGVEFVSYTSALPHSYNFSGNQFNLITEENGDTTITKCENPNGVNIIWVKGDFAQVFRVKGSFGETPAQIDSLLGEDKFIVTGNLFPEQFPEGKGMKNREIYYYDISQSNHVGAVIPTFKRANYEKALHGTVLSPDVWEYYNYTCDIAVRVSPEYADNFINDIRSNHPELRQVGNLRISNVESLEDLEKSVDKESDIELYSWGICILFLLVTVFLGLLGSFWFRTSQRISEIAIRKVNGATASDIFRRLCGEGMILLLFSMPFSAAIVYLVVKMELVGVIYYYADTYVIRIIVEYLGVILLMALTIVAGIWFPARKAMNVEPANILRGE